MGRKLKEEDRIEQIISVLLTLPHNRRCVNCNSLGPQYVCTTFWTFVCTKCSGIHREFTHRVKSVSMGKFSADEVNALQSGGNEQARRIYLKTWDPLRDGFPNSSNLSLMRDFIKRVYVDRRYAGDSPASHNWLSRLKLGDRGDSFEPRSRNPGAGISSCSERCDDRKDRYPSDEGRSYIREYYKFGGSMRGSSRDKRPEDGLHADSTVPRRSATQMFTTADLPPERYSPRNSSAFQKNKGFHTTPARSLIFRDNFLNLQSRNQVKSDEDKKTDKPVSAKVFKIAPPSPSGQPARSVAANTTKKCSDSKSSVDAPTKQELGNESKEPEMGDLLLQDGDDDLASHKPPEGKKVSAVPPKDTIEFLLFELGNPAHTPSDDKSGPSTIGDDAQLETTDFRIHGTDEASASTSSNAEACSSHFVASWPSDDIKAPLSNKSDKAPITTSSNAEACSPHFFPSWPMDNIKAPLSDNSTASHNTDIVPVTSSNTEACFPHFFPSWPTNDIKAPLSNNNMVSHETDQAPVNTSTAEACCRQFIPSWPSDDIKANSSNNTVSHDKYTKQNPTLTLPDTDHAKVKQVLPQSFDSDATYGSGANRPEESSSSGGDRTMSSNALALQSPANAGSSNNLSSLEKGTKLGPVADFTDANLHGSTPDVSKALVLSSKQPQDTSLPSSYPTDLALKFQPESSSSLMSPRVDCSREQPKAANSDSRCNPPLTQANSTVRKELPEDIFTSLYVPEPVAANGDHGWQGFSNYGMGFNMQYQNVTPFQQGLAICQAPQSRNPFDLEDQASPSHGAMLPSRASAQGLSHNVAGISSQSYASQSPAPGVSYAGQNLFNNNTSVQRRESSSDARTDMFEGTLTPTNQLQVGYGNCSTPPATTAVAGNPFG